MSRGLDLLEKARSLRPLIESEADALPAEVTLTKPVIESDPALVRDMMTGSLHVFVDRRSDEEFAKGKLGHG